MKKIITRSHFIIPLLISLLSACGGGGGGVFETDFDDPVGDQRFSAGDVDFSSYVALGDSLTAGFKDGTLYVDGQIDSLANILAMQFEEVGGNPITQPLMSDNLGGLLFMGAANPSFPTRLVLSNVSGSLSPIRQAGTSTTEVFIPLSGGFNNFGIPGAKSFHLLAPGYGDPAGLGVSPATANPFFVRFATSSTTTVVADAAAQAPTFFTLWIGNNDILGYGTTGGDGTDPITDSTTFAGAYNGIVNTLTAGGTNTVKGALINLPEITSIPFFTTVPHNAIPLDQASADAANAAYAAYNGGLATAVAGSLISQMEADLRNINFAAGQNAIVISDEGLTDLSGLGLPSVRQATPADFILLPLSSLLGTERTPGDPATVIGIGSALSDSEALTADEADEIESARQTFNATIQAAADANPNLIFIDAATLLADVADSNGFEFGTGKIDGTFATGGGFSLDGVHPTAKGYAVAANLIIDRINESFSGTNIPRVDPTLYSETFFEFPADFDFSP